MCIYVFLSCALGIFTCYQFWLVIFVLSKFLQQKCVVYHALRMRNIHVMFSFSMCYAFLKCMWLLVARFYYFASYVCNRKVLCTEEEYEEYLWNVFLVCMQRILKVWLLVECLQNEECIVIFSFFLTCYIFLA